MKIGDRVKVTIKNSIWNGKTGTIVAPYSHTSPAWLIKIDDGGNFAASEVELVLETPTASSNIQVGDTVSGTNPYYGAYTAKVLTIDFSKIGTPCEILMNNGHSVIENIGNLTLVVPPIPNVTGTPKTSYSGTTNFVSPFSGSYYGQWTAQDTADYMNRAMRRSTNTPEGEAHKCNWKFYFGMTEKYEFCTLCDKKRETDRWS